MRVSHVSFDSLSPPKGSHCYLQFYTLSGYEQLWMGTNKMVNLLEKFLFSFFCNSIVWFLSVEFVNNIMSYAKRKHAYKISPLAHLVL